MTTLDFADSLNENTFSFGNFFNYSEVKSYGLAFSKTSLNYPFILKGGVSDDFYLEYSNFQFQLRNRLLNTKKIKEIMNSAKIPLLFRIKQVKYLIGKGFLSVYDPEGYHKLLFIACVDGTKNITSIDQVKFYVSKMIYEETHKKIYPAIKDLIGAHSGDVIMCKDILDYIGERLIFPQAVGLSDLNKYKQAVVRTCLKEIIAENFEPLLVETNSGPVNIEYDSMDTSDIIRALRGTPVLPVDISEVAEIDRRYVPDSNLPH